MMMYLPANLKKYRIAKGLTQEEVAAFLGITAQSVSKWERGESYPDITFLPALANIFETSVDLLIGMDAVRAEETRYNIHKTAVEYQKNGEYDKATEFFKAVERQNFRESRLAMLVDAYLRHFLLTGGQDPYPRPVRGCRQGEGLLLPSQFVFRATWRAWQRLLCVPRHGREDLRVEGPRQLERGAAGADDPRLGRMQGSLGA